jgi:ATP-dependent exoDNAse (exonuclease V) beta subunit
MNPQDRAAWLGVLRAPWCGFSLADLHTLASADEAVLLARPVRELLAERLHLLSAEGQAGGRRVLRALEFAGQLRQAQPALSVGTWLEQVWLRLGGAACVEATARTNLDLLWSALDALPDGEPDLVGPALDAALEKLAAQPDPAVDSECGVQLMTIHKSKGLEFEVVIIPELQACSGRGKIRLLSWLERGIRPDDQDEEVEEITEFLIAPLQSKGADRGEAKRWVDAVRRERESQEMRRLLYVAATRAREELHFFARPEYKMAKDDSWEVAAPKGSLLETAWPALEGEILDRFAGWNAPVSAEIEELAAAAEDQSLVAADQAKPAMLRRLPADFAILGGVELPASNPLPVAGMSDLYERHEGGLASRALGNAVHGLLLHLANRIGEQSAEEAMAALPFSRARVVSQVRAIGIDPRQANQIADEAIAIARKTAIDPIGRWILSPHAAAASEVRWAGVVDGVVRTVQIDRVFRAGAAPLADMQGDAEATWWIIDYKTARAEVADSAIALPELRRIFAPQVEAYTRVLRNLQGTGAAIYAGLYYPRVGLFDWWRT